MGVLFDAVVAGWFVVGCGGAKDEHVVSASAAPSKDVWATARHSTVPPELLRYYAPDAARCLATRECPFQGASVPRCASEASDELARAEVGRTVRLRGTLRAMPSGRTQQANCSEAGPCCNALWSQLLVDVRGREVALTESGTVTMRDAFACVGDWSAVCCGFAALGEEVIVSGAVRGSSYYLRHGEEPRVEHPLLVFEVEGLCRAGGQDHEGTNLGRVDLVGR